MFQKYAHKIVSSLYKRIYIVVKSNQKVVNILGLGGECETIARDYDITEGRRWSDTTEGYLPVTESK